MSPPAKPPGSGGPPAGRRKGRRTIDDLLPRLAEMETTAEELHVVEETLRGQQAQVQKLLARFEAEHRWRHQLSALVPLGLCVTDGYGKLLDTNPALASHLQVAPHRLRGKPLSVFLDSADVDVFRTALRDLGRGEAGERRAVVTLHPRHRPVERVELFGFPESPSPSSREARIQWVLVPRAELPAAASPGDGSPQPAESVALVSALAQLASLPIDDSDQQRLLTRMAVLVRSAVPAADWVSITLGSPADPRRIGSDSDEAQVFDGLQLQAGEGPCWAAYHAGEVVMTPDVAVEPRWPHLAKLAADGRVRSALALPVRDGGEGEEGVGGVVNVYSGHRHAFGPDNRQVAELVSAAVTGVLQTVAERTALLTLSHNLEQALVSRAVIDQAKGMLMAWLGVDADEAFARLVTLSTRVNVKVRELARLMVSGEAATVLATLDRVLEEDR